MTSTHQDKMIVRNSKVSKKKVAILTAMCIVGTTLFVLSCTFDLILDKIEHLKMKQMLALTPTSYSFDYWETPPVPVYFQLYVFDIVNPNEVRLGAPPMLVEKGPYTYRVALQKFNITFNKNNTVTYRQRQTFTFQRDRSVGTDNDTFLTVNAPLFTVASLLQYEYPWLKDAVAWLLSDLGEDIFVNVSVHDIFWGYEDKFLQLVKGVLDTFNITSDLITGSFGYYMGRNGSDDGLYTVHTGTDDLNYFLVIDRWNNNKANTPLITDERFLNYWSTSIANMINGTDGSLFPPFVTTDRILQMYDSNLYRSVNMVYREGSSVLGIPTMKFVVDDDEFANASINPWNAGFCTPNTNYCIPSGVLNCSAMGHGAPLYVSLPHFLGADQYYFDRVSGLSPDRAKHQPYFHLHQLTGVCLSAGRRYQLNIQIKNYSFLRKTSSLSLAYVPVLWINGLAEVDETIVDMFKDQIETPLAIVTALHYACYGFGPLLVLAPLLWVLARRLHARRQMMVPASMNTQQQERVPILNGNDQA